LQKAHDFVETNEFDCGAYGAHEGAELCCYIGSVRQGAEEYGKETFRVANEASNIALFALDIAAIRFGAREEELEDCRPGSAAEAWGFDGPGDDKKAALGAYRKALRLMHTELTSRDDAPVPA
jgi:hypothetical protein